MTLPGLVADLARAGVRLRLAGEDRIEVTAPRGGLTDELRRRIAAHKPELVRWLAEPLATPAALPAVTPDRPGPHEPFPLADLQVSFLVGGSGAMEYHVRPHEYLEMDLDDLDPARFEVAWNRALHRQRANLVVVTPDLRLQAVTDPEPMRVPVADLRGLPEDERTRALLATRAAMERQTLPLDRWPWMELRLSMLDGGRARLHYNNNNFFSDGYGTNRLLQTALAAYRRPEEPLPDLSLSFRDCVLALAALEESPLGEESRRYWCGRMADWPEPAALPMAAGADPRERSGLRRRDAVLPAATWTAFRERAGRHGLTPTNALFALYAEIVAAWSGSRHFLLNNMVTHRLPIHPEIGEVLGNLASLYPLEVDWRHDEPFHARALRLQARVMADLRHVHWSGVRVLQTLNQARGTPGRAACPLVVASGLFMGAWDRPPHSTLETPQVVLDHQFWEQTDGGLWVIWDVLEHVFPEGLIDAMMDAHRALFERLAGDEAAWEEAGFDLAPAAQLAVRRRLNRSDEPVPDGLLHGPLAARAAEEPDRVAVVTPAGATTYAELDRRAGAVAVQLAAAGVRPGDLVAVALPRGGDQVAAQFGVLRAGAAYVPVDPAWPRERVELLLRDAGVSAVVGAGGVELGPAPARRGVDGLAYVIYTSGSTGRPKGAMLGHRGALNTIADVNRRFAVTPADVVLGLSSPCFDLSVYDVFGTVAAGATLVLPDESRAADPAAWLEAVIRHGVTVWNSVPQLMQLLVEAASAAGVTLPSLRLVLLSGDWIPVRLPEQVAAVAPGARVVSLGGATEASIWSICHPIDRVDPDWPSVPYGRPLANQTWHVLDDAGRDAPDWVPGHLHVGGDGVALGYWNDPERTAAAFVRHPRTGERLYRTGDLGRYRPDGTIEFLGRSDFQVKVQGFRVEPGEIEHLLAAHPEVREALVIARDAGGGRQLVAFAVAAPGARPDGEALREHLAAALPRHMVPARVTVLDRLPLTANGKTDRRALEAMDGGGGPGDARREFTAPRTPLETELAAIWEAVLGTAPIGVHDDFFALGGQSFTALRAVTEIDRRLGRRVPMGALLEGRTIAHLARRLEAGNGASPLVRLADGGAGEPWFLVHPAGGGVVCYRELADALRRPVHAFQALTAEAGDVEAIASRYVRALRAVRPAGPYLLGGWSSGGVIAFEMARQLEREGAPARRVVVLDAPAPAEVGPVAEADLRRWFAEDADAGLDAAQAEPVFAVYRAVVLACRRYRPVPIGAEITVLRAAEGTVGEYAGHPCAGRPDWGWGAWTRGGVAAMTVAGTHRTMLRPPHVAALAGRLAPLLDEP